MLIYSSHNTRQIVYTFWWLKKVEKANTVEFDWIRCTKYIEDQTESSKAALHHRLLLFSISFLLSYKACEILKCVTRDARLCNYHIFFV